MTAEQKKVVLITGANKGVGYETAKVLLASPTFAYHVLIGSRDLAAGEAAVTTLTSGQEKDQLHGTASAIQLDVTDAASIQAAAQQIKTQYGRLDSLVNNAGISSKGQDTATQIRENLETNVVGPVLVTEALEPLLKQSADPRVIFVSSSLSSLTHASDPESPYYASRASTQYDYYRVSKTALNMVMVQFAKRNPGVKTWAGDPGWLATDLADKALMETLGAPHPSVGGREIARIVEGERDADVGKIVGKYGVQKW